MDMQSCEELKRHISEDFAKLDGEEDWEERKRLWNEIVEFQNALDNDAKLARDDEVAACDLAVKEKSSKLEVITTVVTIVTSVVGAGCQIFGTWSDRQLKQKALDDNLDMFDRGVEFEKTGTFTTNSTRSMCTVKPNKV